MLTWDYNSKYFLIHSVYDYPILNGNISTLMTLLKDYYLKEIVPFLFKYEFLK